MVWTPGPNKGVRADDARLTRFEHGCNWFTFDACDVGDQAIGADMGSGSSDDFSRFPDIYRHQGDICLSGGILDGEFRVTIHGEDLIAQIVQKGGHEASHAARSTDDCDPLWRHVQWDRGVELGLPVPTCPQHHPEEALDDVRAQATAAGPRASVGQEFSFTGVVANRDIALALDRGHLADDLVPLGQKGKKLMVDLVNPIPECREGGRDFRGGGFFWHRHS